MGRLSWKLSSEAMGFGIHQLSVQVHLFASICSFTKSISQHFETMEMELALAAFSPEFLLPWWGEGTKFHRTRSSAKRCSCY